MSRLRVNDDDKILYDITISAQQLKELTEAYRRWTSYKIVSLNTDLNRLKHTLSRKSEDQRDDYYARYIEPKEVAIAKFEQRREEGLRGFIDIPEPRLKE